MMVAQQAHRSSGDAGSVMDIWVAVLGVLVLAGTIAAGYLVYLQVVLAGKGRPVRSPAGRSRPGAAAAAAKPFRATAIRPGREACAAVRALAGSRYLVSEAEIPGLPLPDCDIPRCSCTYEKFPDRRDDEEDRRGPAGMQQRLREQGGGGDRRSGRDRRAGSAYSWD